MTKIKPYSFLLLLFFPLFQLTAQIEIVSNDKRNYLAERVRITEEYLLRAGLEGKMSSFRRLQYQKVDLATSEITSYYCESPTVNGERSMASSWKAHGDYIYELYMINKPKSLLLYKYGILKREINTFEQVGEIVIIGDELEENYFKESSIHISDKGILSISYAKKHALISSFNLDLVPIHSETSLEISNKTKWVDVKVNDENFFVTYSNIGKPDIKKVLREYTISKEEVNALYIDPLAPSSNFSMSLWLPEPLITTWFEYELDADKKQIIGYFFTHDKPIGTSGYPQKGNTVTTYLWSQNGARSEGSSIKLDYNTVLGEEGREFIENSDKKSYANRKEEFPYIVSPPLLEKRNDGSVHIVYNSLLENSTLYDFLDSRENASGTVNGFATRQFKEEALESCAYSLKFVNGKIVSDHFMYPGQKSDIE